MKKETIQALTELARAAAKAYGWNDETPIEFTVCRPKEHHSFAEIFGDDSNETRFVGGFDFADPKGDTVVFSLTDGKTFRLIENKD